MQVFKIKNVEQNKKKPVKNVENVARIKKRKNVFYIYGIAMSVYELFERPSYYRKHT